MKTIEIKTIEEIEEKLGLTKYSNPENMTLLLLKTRKNAYLFLKVGTTYNISCTLEQYERNYTEKDFNWFRNRLVEGFDMEELKNKICDEILDDSGMNFSFLKTKNK
jgi:hypothetical protein